MQSIILNYTPHPITVQHLESLTIYPSIGVARVSVRQEAAGEINGIPCSRQSLGHVVDLPEPVPDVYYIVSSVVKSATSRADVIAPDTGKNAIRDQDGHIVAVRGFII